MPPSFWNSKYGPSLLILAIILGLVLAGRLAAEALEPPPEPPFDLGGARISPVSGWQIQQQAEGQAVLTNGVVFLAVFAGAVDGTAREVLDAYIQQAVASGADVSVSEPAALVDFAHDAVRVTYSGVTPDGLIHIAGEITVLVSRSGQGVIFDAQGPRQVLSLSIGDVHEMIDRSVLV